MVIRKRIRRRPSSLSELVGQDRIHVQAATPPRPPRKSIAQARQALLSFQRLPTQDPRPHPG